MTEVIVNLSTAMICFLGQCHPVLLGDSLYPGKYPIVHARIEQPGYGGDVLAFGFRPDGVSLSVHRVWLGAPSQRRLERLQGPLEGRKGITGGCVNVDPAVYDALVDCCSDGTLIVEK